VADPSLQNTQRTPQLALRYPQPLPVRAEDVPAWLRRFIELETQRAVLVENRINEVERKIPTP
jgi:hypothetical protein